MKNGQPHYLGCRGSTKRLNKSSVLFFFSESLQPGHDLSEKGLTTNPIKVTPTLGPREKEDIEYIEWFWW